MKGKNEKKNTFVAENACGSHFFVICSRFEKEASIGEMLEWLKRHAWKACIPLKRVSGVRIPVSPQDERKTKTINEYNKQFN